MGLMGLHLFCDACRHPGTWNFWHCVPWGGVFQAPRASLGWTYFGGRVIDCDGVRFHSHIPGDFVSGQRLGRAFWLSGCRSMPEHKFLRSSSHPAWWSVAGRTGTTISEYKLYVYFMYPSIK